MKKFFAFLGLSVTLGGLTAQEADYTSLCKWDEVASPRRIMLDSRGATIAERIVQSLSISGATVRGESKTYVMPVAGVNHRQPVSKINFDRTKEPPVQVSKGDVIAITPSVHQLEWMHYYMYIDYDHNGKFDTNELVSYTHFREQGSDKFYDSTGALVPTGSIYNGGKLPAFTISQDAKFGKTMARFKCDWNSKDPCGDAELAQNRGVICDFIVEIVGAEAQTSAITINADAQHGAVQLYDKSTDAVVPDLSAIANGTQLELRIAPNEGYEVRELKVNNVDKLSQLKNGKLALIVEADTQISVQFAKKTYGVFVTKIGAQGVEVVLRNAETQDNIDLKSRIEHGTQVKLYATAPAGYRFTNFVVNNQSMLDDLVAANDGLLITMTRDLRIMYTIEEQLVNFIYNYDMSQGVVTATLEDGVTPVQSGGTVRVNTVVFLKVEPHAGYELASIIPKDFPDLNVSDILEKVDGTENTYIIEVAEGDVEFSVNFRQKTAVEELKALGYDVRTTMDAVVIDGVVVGDLVELYNAAGVRVARTVAAGSQVIFPVHKGVYVLKVDKAVAKVVVR